MFIKQAIGIKMTKKNYLISIWFYLFLLNKCFLMADIKRIITFGLSYTDREKEIGKLNQMPECFLFKKIMFISRSILLFKNIATSKTSQDITHF